MALQQLPKKQSKKLADKVEKMRAEAYQRQATMDSKDGPAFYVGYVNAQLLQLVNDLNNGIF